MLDNRVADEDETRRNVNVVQQKDVENMIGRTWEQRRNSREN